MLNEQFTRTFEYPRAEIKIDVDKLYIKCDQSPREITGTISVENIGYGNMTCEISSNLEVITFVPSQWSGNSQTIQYAISADTLKAGNIYRGEVVISSSGGEAVLPLTVEVTPQALYADDATLYSLKEFNDLYETDKERAKQIFFKPDFIIWLEKQMPRLKVIYQRLTLDSNKDRVVDNFLVAAGQKEKTELTLFNDYITIDISPYVTTENYYEIFVKKTDNGYVDGVIDTKFDVPWLKLGKTKLLDSDFDSELTAKIPYVIQPEKLTSSKNYNIIEIITDDTVLSANIVISSRKLFNISLSQESYRVEDEGSIVIDNNSGRDIQVEVFAIDNYIRFNGRKFTISRHGEIRFSVKATGLAAGFSGLFQKPIMYSEIQIRAVVADKIVKKSIQVAIGNL